MDALTGAAIAIGLCWILVKKEFLFKIIPR